MILSFLKVEKQFALQTTLILSIVFVFVEAEIQVRTTFHREFKK